jgi:hypothetical protein
VRAGPRKADTTAPLAAAPATKWCRPSPSSCWSTATASPTAPTARQPIKELVIRAERLRTKVEIDGKIEDVRGVTLGAFRFTTAFEKKVYTYPVPVLTLVGKLGEANGPTLEEWRHLQRLRQAFKQGLDWMPQDAIDPPAPPEALPASPGKGSIDIRSGHGAWDDGAPPHTDYEGPEDDEISI